VIFDYKLSYVFLLEACEKIRPLLTSWYPLTRRVCGPESQVGPFGKKETFLPLLDIRRRLPCQWKTAHDLSRPATVTGA
jgi:hypothetical protein